MILNLIGIYGVGWLMLNKLPGGILLLVGSLLFWPVEAIIGVLTMGLGILCLGPVAIGAMVLNIVLLQQAIKHKAAC